MKNETRVPISRITLRALAILAAAGSINVQQFLYRSILYITLRHQLDLVMIAQSEITVEAQ